MSLSHREKQRFFDSLARFVHTGITIPAALDKLGGTSGGALRPVMKSLRRAFADGQGVAEAFRAQHGALGVMEASVIGAAERTGRLDHVLHQLSDYHGALAQAREQARAKLLYPAFLFHFGVLALSLPRLLPKSELSTEPAGIEHGLIPYLWTTLGTFAVLYATAFVIVSIARALGRMATRSAAIDSLLSMIPLVGKVRRNFALARFCMTYELHLGAGVNAIEALDTAADASQSGCVRKAVARAIPEVRGGAPVGETFASADSLPGELIEGLLVGEESGQLDKTLLRLAEGYQADAIAALQALAEWLPRLIYLVIVGYMAFMIVRVLSQVWLGPINKLLNSEVS